MKRKSRSCSQYQSAATQAEPRRAGRAAPAARRAAGAGRAARCRHREAASSATSGDAGAEREQAEGGRGPAGRRPRTAGRARRRAAPRRRPRPTASAGQGGRGSGACAWLRRRHRGSMPSEMVRPGPPAQLGAERRQSASASREASAKSRAAAASAPGRACARDELTMIGAVVAPCAAAPAGAHRRRGVAALRADAGDQQRQASARARGRGRSRPGRWRRRRGRAWPLRFHGPAARRGDPLVQALAGREALRLQVGAARVGGAAEQDQALACVAQVGLDRIEAHEGRQASPRRRGSARTASRAYCSAVAPMSPRLASRITGTAGARSWMCAISRSSCASARCAAK